MLRLPPTLAGQTGGDGFNIANGFGGVTLKWKTIHPRMIDRLNDFLNDMVMFQINLKSQN